MSSAIAVSLLAQMFLAGAGRGCDEFITIEKLSERMVLAYWVGTDRRCNLTAIKSQKGLTLEQTTKRLAVRTSFPPLREAPPGAWSHGMHERNVRNLWRLLKEEQPSPLNGPGPNKSLPQPSNADRK